MRPLAHQAHVERGAAGIGDDGGIDAAVGLGVGAAGDRRHGRAGVDRVDRRVRHVGGIHGAALGGHHQHAAAEAGVAQSRFQTAQIVAHERLERGVDAGGRRAAVLAERGVEHVRERVGHPRQVALEQRADAELVLRVDDRPEQADGDRLDLPVLQLVDDGDDGRLVERLGHGAVVGHALGHLVGERARHVGLGVGHGEVEGLDAPALAKHQNVRVPPGGEEGGARGVAGHDRVDRVRGAVDQHLAPAEQGIAALAQVLGGAGERLQHAGDRVRRRRRRLVHAQAAVVGLDDEVGERSPGIDRESHGTPAVSSSRYGRRSGPPGGRDPSPDFSPMSRVASGGRLTAPRIPEAGPWRRRIARPRRAEPRPCRPAPRAARFPSSSPRSSSTGRRR